MKIVVTAGGGGHFAPALSVIKTLPKETSVLIIGRKYAFEGDKTISLEYRTAKSLGIPFSSITTARLQRSFTRHTIPSLLKLPLGLFQALKLLGRYQPDAVMSFGGYVAVPVTLAARILGIPVVIHEQTLGAGLSNKVAAHFASVICLSWEESRKHFEGKNVVVTGNPLREEILRQSDDGSPLPKDLEKIPLIYITGGSLGSHAINMIVKESIDELTKNFVVFHQTGDAQEFNDYEKLCLKKDELPEDRQERYLLTKFVNPASVGALLRSADIVIARSGINTVSELIYLNKPAILIPLPHGQNNEQEKNASFFEKNGLGIKLDQANLKAEKLLRLVNDVWSDRKKYSIEKTQRERLIHVDAAVKMRDILLNVAQKEKTSKRS